MNFINLNASIQVPDTAAATAARARWDHIAKPLGSLGLLETAVVRIAGLTGSPNVCLEKRAALVLCADNGVVAEGVTQTGPEITALLAGNMVKGETSVCCMAKNAHADVIPVDMGMLHPVPGVLNRRIAAGTQNMVQGPAMSKDQALQALQTGIDLVRDLKESGYKILATGEMGIGNTTSSSAVCAALLDMPVPAVTGRGAGLSNQALSHKISVIQRAIAVNRPNRGDALDVLSKLGGFDIAGLSGVFLGGALYRVPVLIDGFISAVSALAALRLCPNSRCAMLASHCSAEPAAAMVLDALGLSAPIQAGLRLGEGTGALCMLPMLDMALSVYHEMSTFAGIGMAAYTPQGDAR